MARPGSLSNRLPHGEIRVEPFTQHGPRLVLKRKRRVGRDVAAGQVGADAEPPLEEVVECLGLLVAKQPVDFEAIRPFCEKIRLTANLCEGRPRITEISPHEGVETYASRRLRIPVQRVAPAVPVPAAKPADRLAHDRGDLHLADETLKHRPEQSAVAPQ